MSLKFDEALNIVAEKILEAPKPKYQTYLQDAAEISAKMDQELVNINSMFKETISNWDEIPAFYQAEVPKFHTPFLQLKMPFAVEPQRVFVFSNAVGELVNLKTSVNHPAVENGYLNGEKLIQLFIWDLNKVIDRISQITCSSGKTYTLAIIVIKNPIGGMHSILIGAEENDSEDGPSILYTFTPLFIFKNSSHYVYDSNFFRQAKESDTIAHLNKVVKVMDIAKILLQTLINKSSKISPINLVMALETLWKEYAAGLGYLLLKAIPRCIPHLQNPGPLKSAYRKLLQFKQSDSVQLSELMEVFGQK